MKIIDAQVHIWGTGAPLHMHRQVSSFAADALLAEMKAAGVDGAILHPPSWDPASNALSIEAVQNHPGKFGILGNFPLDDPRSRLMVKEWMTLPGMLGLRFALVPDEQQRWVRDGSIDWMWAAAERAGIPVATMGGRFLPEFRAIAERHPDLTLIIDHLGLARMAKDGDAFANLPELLALARLPNVYINATGAPAYSSHPYPFRNLHDGLHRIFDAFGPRRFFWGTDITRMPCGYRECVTMFTEELPWLSGDDLELVMGKAVCDVLGCPSLGAPPA
jgi:predicted TIM-barrel fold metal-dependent hydrolase